MGVVPRKFFCWKCNRMRWPGDCEHARTMSGLGDLSLMKRQMLFDDVCRGCGETPRACGCPANMRNERQLAVAGATAARVLALTGCSCKHHITAYLADDVAKTIACGACCVLKEDSLPLTLGPGLGFNGTPRTDIVDNADRRPVSKSYVRNAIEYGLSEEPERELIRDNRMPGWVTNGHFMAFAGNDEADGFFSRHRTRESSILSDFRAWEAAGPGQRVLYSSVRCEPKEAPVDMMGWGKPGWTGDRPRPVVTIVAPDYSSVLLGASTNREKGHDDEALSMLLGWNNGKISSIVMPRREIIIE